MLLLKPERSAIIRMNPGGRSQVDFDTVAGDTVPEDWLIELETAPIPRTVSEMASSTRIVITNKFRGAIIEQLHLST